MKVETQTANANTNGHNSYHVSTIRTASGENRINVTVYNRDGVEYRVFSSNGGYYGGGISVVNHTKELLEVELLKQQLGK